MKIEFIEYSSPGLVRKNNQDSIFAKAKGEYGLFVVADGMGGHEHGEIASARLTEAFVKWWKCNSENIPYFEKYYSDIKNILKYAVQTWR